MVDFPPHVGMVSINVYAALFPGSNWTGRDTVLHDHLGIFELACSEGINGITSSQLAEAMTIQRQTMGSEILSRI
jgi:hypothetical protein